MPAKINLLNQRFGSLVAIEETTERKNKSVVWKCKCDCGTEIFVSTKELRSDGVTSCKQCKAKRQPITQRREDLVVRTFNRLTVLEKTNKRRRDCFVYKCQCSCGTICEVCSRDLLNGSTQSCGCLRYKYKIGDVINNRKILDYAGTKGNNFYYHCQCLFCGREYDALAHTLDSTISCGCQKSIGEYNIANLLHDNGITYIKEYQFPGSLYRYDFAILNRENLPIRLIEFDGEQHYIQNIKSSGWNTYTKYEITYQNDLQKNQLAKEHNLPLVRIPYWERDNISLDLILGDKYLIQ